MIDDIVELAVAASIDVAMQRAARRRRWVRVLQVVIGLAFVALIAAAIYITLRYS